MSAPRLWEPERDGQKPSCDRCKVHRHTECRDLIVVPRFGRMACGCHMCAMQAIALSSERLFDEGER